MNLLTIIILGWLGMVIFFRGFVSILLVPVWDADRISGEICYGTISIGDGCQAVPLPSQACSKDPACTFFILSNDVSHTGYCYAKREPVVFAVGYKEEFPPTGGVTRIDLVRVGPCGCTHTRHSS